MPPLYYCVYCLALRPFAALLSSLKMVNNSDYSLILEVNPVKSTRELRSMIRMHSSIFTSPRHYHSPTPTRQPCHRIRRASTFPTTSIMGTNPSSLSSTSTNADHDLGIKLDTQSTTINPEAEKIQRNSLYLTFNAPQVDEYVSTTFRIHSVPRICTSFFISIKRMRRLSSLLVLSEHS